MKKHLASLAVIAALFGIIPTEASAWYCRATSVDGSGWARREYRGAAVRVALAQCASVTYRRHTCYLRFCRPGD